MTGGEVPEQDALRARIERTRAELGETVEALAAKTDVTARATTAARRFVDRVRSALPGWRIWRWGRQ